MGKYSYTLKILTWIFRFICGGLFIYSGFVKAIDPWGFIFKIEDYLAVFGFPMPFALTRLGVFGLCAVEFIVGCFLLMGCFRKSCPVFAALIMAFMLPFSLWIAMTDPVADCGCFGDALKISNWFTFWKNVILSGGIIFLLRYNLAGICLISPAFQWIAVMVSGMFIVLIELIGYFYQPLLDFRDYPEGTALFYDEDADSDHGIDVFDIESGDDMNHEAMSPGEEIVVMIPKVSMVSPATTGKLNAIYDWAEARGIKMIGVVSGSPEEIDEWKDLSMASYPLYLADDSAIKQVVRGNPGIVYLDDGKIVWKSTLSALDEDDFLEPDMAGDASYFKRDNTLMLRNIIAVYLIVMAFLVFISFTPRMANLLIRGGLASKRGVRHH